MSPEGTRTPAPLIRAAVVVLVASCFALADGDARAEPRNDETAFEKPAPVKLQPPLIARSKEDKCEEYAELTDTNVYFCTRYMNERLVEIMLTSAKKAKKPTDPIPSVGR